MNVTGGNLTGNNHTPALATGACSGGTQYAWNFGQPQEPAVRRDDQHHV